MPPPPPPPPRPPPRGLPPVLGGVVALYGVLLRGFSRESVKASLRARIESALRSRLGGDVTIGQEVQLAPLLRVTFGPVTLAGSRPGDPPLVRIERVKVRP